MMTIVYLLKRVIDVEKGKVITVDVSEPQLRIVRSLLGLVGPDETLRYGQHRGDGKYLVGAIVLARSNQHFRQLRVERKFCHDGAELSQVAIVVEGSEIIKEPGNGNMSNLIQLHHYINIRFFVTQRYF